MHSVFSKIIHGELPGKIIWEDKDVISIIPKSHFVNPGHILVIPKIEVDYIFDLDEEIYFKLWHVCRFLSKPLKEITTAKRIGIAVEGFSVPHVHIHLCPIYEVTQLDPHRNEAWSQDEQQIFLKKMKEKLSEPTTLY